ncbi:MAG: hypothetical protein ACXWCG_02080 [Flavitalea sp.]
MRPFLLLLCIYMSIHISGQTVSDTLKDRDGNIYSVKIMKSRMHFRPLCLRRRDFESEKITFWLDCFLTKSSGNIPEKQTETGYNKKGLPGDNVDVKSSSSFADIINNVIVVDAEVNGQG